MTRSTNSARTIATSTSSSTISPSRIHPATSSAISGARQRPTSTAAAIPRASRIPPSTSWSTKSCSAKDRADLVAATHALDRVLLWNYYVVPHWNYPYERLAYWDVFGRPAKLPSQTSALTQVWWIRRRQRKKPSKRRRRNDPRARIVSNANDNGREVWLSRRAALCCSPLRSQASPTPSRATASRSSAN